ncbi:3-oxoacyl-ACP synthase [Nocardia panacis]|uniref:3-oxoacyl-ACP synthase n=1 Tax=Nocardia panacis TaxID=2340916 RepID=A0A3A4KUZ2_9NOCA|nr:beta-ketoacyl synthase N-terminal-like domain-containing protein [Nocardia panacis]RJO78955.1 3-oxoacyl-ACP synthase [Nocardia panacis]
MSGTCLNIVGWSATSPFGFGRVAFAEGVCAGRATDASIDEAQWSIPAGRACVVPDFDVRATLGKKGTRTMNRLTGLAVSTVGDLLDAVNRDAPPEEIGLVLGTTLGSAQSAMDLTRGSLTATEPFRVESGLIPYAVMNGAAGQCAIWHNLRGPNATLAGGRAAGLLALNYARRLLLTGRARTVFAGSAEEYSEARQWIAQAAGESGRVLGEGCAMFALTTAPVPDPVVELHAVRAMSCPDGDWRSGVRRCVEHVLSTIGVAADQVWAACPSGAAGKAGLGERAGLGDVVPDKVVLAPVTELVGETEAVSAMFQLAAVLSLAERDPASAGRFALITSIDDGGTVAAALLRLPVRNS